MPLPTLRTKAARSKVVKQIPDSQGIQDSQDISESQGIDESQDAPDSQGIQESLSIPDSQAIPDSQCDYDNEADAAQDSDTTQDNEADPVIPVNQYNEADPADEINQDNEADARNEVNQDNEADARNEVNQDSEVNSDNEVDFDNEVDLNNEVDLDNEVGLINGVYLDNEASCDNEVYHYNEVKQEKVEISDSEESDDVQIIEPIQESEVVDMKDSEIIIKRINDCLLPKLAKNYDECDTHAEFVIRNNHLDEKIITLMEELKKYEFKRSFGNVRTKSYKANTVAIVSSLLNLYKELLCNCSWNSDNNKEYAKKLDDCFNRHCRTKLTDILKINDVCDSQAVYDKCLDELCQKLTSEDFKKYPGQVEVYCDLVQNCNDIDVKVKPLKFLPVALILMDDYIDTNKLKGLLCCQVLLKKLATKDFDNGNYYDVIYMGIKNTLNHRDIKITEISQSCALQLCQIFPSDIKDEKLDEMYTAALEQLNTETNLFRKAAYFKYTKKIMEMLEIKCVGKSVFKTVICDAIENCLTDSVAEILLMPSLECLEEWIKYCWPVWKLPVDFKVLCALLKYYSKCNTGEGGLLTQKLIVTLVSLCTPEEQRQFTAQLEGKDEVESTRMDGLKKDIGINTNLD